MIFSVTKYSIFWDMRVIKEYQETLCNCCNRDWKKIFDVEETCLVMCAVHIGIHRWNSIIIISVGANRRNLMTITSISLYFPTFAYVLTFLTLFHIIGQHHICITWPYLGSCSHQSHSHNCMPIVYFSCLMFGVPDSAGDFWHAVISYLWWI